MLKVTNKWHSEIADLRQKYYRVTFMRDIACENKSQEIINFIESVGGENWLSTPYQQLANGHAESAINSVMRFASTQMAETGLGGTFWFKASATSDDALNITFKHHLGLTQWTHMYNQTKDISLFCAF